MSSETMYNVAIDVKTEVFDTTQNRVTETTRENAIDIRLGGTTRLVAVLKAYEKVRTKDGVKGNLNNLEVEVDGVNFQG